MTNQLGFPSGAPSQPLSALVDDGAEIRGVTRSKGCELATRDVARKDVVEFPDDGTRLLGLPDDKVDSFGLQRDELDAGDVHRLALVADCYIG